MFKGKKWISANLAIVLMISLMLAACSAKDSGNTIESNPASQANGSPSSSDSQESPSAAALEPYEISWYFMGPGEQKDAGEIEKAVNEYLKDKINATIKFYSLDWGTYEAKMKAMIAAGETFDIAFTATWFNNYVENARKKAFVPLNDLLDKYAPKTKELLGDKFLKGSQIDGVNYAIPANKEKARNYGYLYNKNIAEKYGFDMSTVKQWSDLEPMLQVIKEKETGIVPIIRGKTINDIEWNAANVDEVGLMLPDGKYYNQYETSEFKEAYDLARKFYQAGFYRKDVAVQKDTEQVISSGKFFINAVNLKPGYADEQNVKNKQNGFEVVQIDITKPVVTNSETMGSLQAISSTSKNPERAMMFLELFNTDPYLNNLINFGIEGKHYKKISDQVIEPIADSGYNMGMTWMFGNQFINYLLPTEDPNKWQMFEDYNNAAVPALDLGFIFNSEPVKSEIAATNNVIKQYKEVLDYGAVDPASQLPKFIDKLKAAGSDKIVAEKQKQFDEWKAAQS